MCTLSLTKTADEQLKQLQGDRKKLENNLKQRCFEANVSAPGLLDHGDLLHSPFPQDLRNAGLRKVTIGRHRVYYLGSHKDCNYDAVYVKLHKKSDNWAHDDNNPAFQNRIRTALSTPVVKTLLEDGTTIIT